MNKKIKIALIINWILYILVQFLIIANKDMESNISIVYLLICMTIAFIILHKIIKKYFPKWWVFLTFPLVIFLSYVFFLYTASVFGWIDINFIQIGF